MTDILLDVRNLRKHFGFGAGLFGGVSSGIRAVDGVSFQVKAGETLGLVGESGCGKSTLGRTILGLLKPSAGEIWFQGQNLAGLSRGALRRVRKDIQMVFQDPYSSLDPRMSVRATLAEALQVHGLFPDKDAREARLVELMKLVGLQPDHLSRFPHEFSGGQRQRVGIARALAVAPKLVICDEPVSALDVSVQAQVVNLLQDLQEQMKLTYIFIGHDLSVVRHVSTRVAVMYLGRIVEIAETEALYESPAHPYTEALLAAVPVAHPRLRRGKKSIITGDLPSPANPPSGCRFHPRCVHRVESCSTNDQELREIRPGHWVACQVIGVV